MITTQSYTHKLIETHFFDIKLKININIDLRNKGLCHQSKKHEITLLMISGYTNQYFEHLISFTHFSRINVRMNKKLPMYRFIMISL